MKKLLLLLPLLALLTFSGFSQTDKFWSANYESRSNIIADKAVSRQSYPKEVKLFNINFESFKNQLFSVAGKTTKVFNHHFPAKCCMEPYGAIRSV